MEERKAGMPLHTKIFLALILGAIAGAAVQFAGYKDAPNTKWFIDNLARPAGEIFLALIMMIVVPLLFSALVLGVAEIGQARKVGKVGLYALGMTVLLSGIAVILGLLAVNAFKPGAHMTESERQAITQRYVTPDTAKKAEEYAAKAKEAKTAAQTIVEIVPRNPLKEAVEGNFLPFMFFALMFGLALSAIDAERSLPVRNFLDGVFGTSLKVIEFAMKFAPIGVFGLIFIAASTLGGGAIAAMGSYVAIVLITLAFHQFVVFSGAIKLIAKRSPMQFFRQIKGVMLTAFTTSSSNATLPTALRSAEEDVGLPRDVSSFVLTVGATANQNGTALFEGVTILFLAQCFGVEMGMGQQVTVMLMSILAGIGTAGVPGGSWPMIAAIMGTVGFNPQEVVTGVGMCLGIDRILDMSRTVLNVSGDMTIATCVSHLAGEEEVPALG